MNTYSALMGETPMSRERARSELKEALLATAIPQYRMLKKSNDAFDAVRRGYATDMGGNYVHPSSPFGEFMNFLGVPPEEYKRGKNLAKEWTQVAHDYNYEKHAAIDSLIKEGNSQGIQEFTTKWGRPITPQDIQKVMQTAQQTPLERATKTIPPEVIKQLAGERPYLFNR